MDVTTRGTRLVLFGPNGARVQLRDRIVGMDLSEIHNNNASAPVGVVVEQECDMGHWHGVGQTALPLYDLGHDGTDPIP